MDFATCMIAEGKLKVARAKGEMIAPGCFVDGQGEPSVDPKEYYADPPGAILPIAAHKGYALSLFADVLAGAVAGGSCSQHGVDQIANGWFAIFVDPEAFCGRAFYNEQVGALGQWVKSSKTMRGFDEVLLPGEPEERAFAERSRRGIPIELSTWQKICAIAEAQGVPVPAGE